MPTRVEWAKGVCLCVGGAYFQFLKDVCHLKIVYAFIDSEKAECYVNKEQPTFFYVCESVFHYNQTTLTGQHEMDFVIGNE